MYKTRGYQYAGSAFLAQRSAILGDLMGLGKTHQALLAVEQADTQKNLIICPLSIKPGWIKEMRNLYESVAVEELDNNVIKVTVARRGKQREFYLTHYQQYINNSKVLSKLLATKWDAVICDEVHRIKNRTAQSTKNIKQLNTKFKWGLTGTPIADKPDDLWSILNWVAPKAWSSYWTFVNNFCDMKYNPFSGSKKPNGLKRDKSGSTDATLQILYRLTAPYLLARNLEDVGLELPPVVHTTVPLEMADTQRKFYQQVTRDIYIELQTELEGSDKSSPYALDLSGERRTLLIQSAGARFVRLQQVASDPTVFKANVSNTKLQWLKDYVEDGGKPALIFTRFNHTANTIRAYLDSVGAEDFIVGTWAKLSEGHNFQHLSVTIAWDMPLYLLEWTQGLARTHRPGQKADHVQIIRLICEGSVDVEIEKMIDRKGDVSTVIMEWLRGLNQ